jgi:hypothetical protein
MTAGLLTRLARVEARFPAAPTRWDMSDLPDDELEMLTALPRDETKLRAHIEDPAYDWMLLARILERLEPVR